MLSRAYKIYSASYRRQRDRNIAAMIRRNRPIARVFRQYRSNVRNRRNLRRRQGLRDVRHIMGRGPF